MAVAALGWQQGWWRLPDRHNPFAPLVVDEVPNWLTGFKLARAQRDPERCAQLVGVLPWRVEPLPDRRTGEGCGFTQAWRVSTMGEVGVGEAFSLSCPSVLALAMWQRHTLAPAAQRHFGDSLQRVQHVGSYACRNVYGREGAARSRHATAEALDVIGFMLRSGRRVGVKRDWGNLDSASVEAAFLRDAHDGACRWFHGVLGPDYNAAHRDHFHLETGGWRTCR
ncbi:hypothetical protein ASD88_11035 [Pelomonas sp. Root662]|nr:hypothetical protein ASC81_11035 [Pelomonas sp. Root405]KRA72711.1 hypothetical protein ASD88_11035 [Pelomonas sp. Root662]